VETLSLSSFVLPHEDNHLRKLCLVYLEIVDKTGPQGKMLPEMILVCNMIRNELTHPNEYSRGCALRFVCKIKEAEILEPLVPAVRQNLEHRHSFVRRNAILAIHMVFRNFEYLIPDAPELVYRCLQGETDVACKRNAFEMLCSCDEEKAVNYLVQSLEVVPSWGEILQLSALKLIRTICKSKPEEKATFIQLIFNLLQSTSASVAFEAANVLFSLSQSTTAVRAAVECYCRLLLSQSDNNVRLILLDRLEEIRTSHLSVMQEVLFDMMRILASPNLEIRKKVLSLASDLVTSRNAQPIINLIRKEIHGLASEVGEDFEVTLQYRQLLLRFIRNIAMNFPDCVTLATGVLEEFVDDEFASVAPDAVVALREVAVKYPYLQASIVERLGHILTSGLRNPRVLRGIFWILAEFSSNGDQVNNSFQAILHVVSPLPLSPHVTKTTETEVFNDVQSVSSDHSFHSVSSKKPKVLADGTYATQTVIEELSSGLEKRDLSKHGPAVRSLILSGDYFLGVAVCSAITKLALKSRKLVSKQTCHKMTANAMLLCSSLLRFAQSLEAPGKMDSGSAERIILCILSMTRCSWRCILNI
jgi:coatomer subunit beta